MLCLHWDLQWDLIIIGSHIISRLLSNLSLSTLYPLNPVVDPSQHHYLLDPAYVSGSHPCASGIHFP